MKHCSKRLRPIEPVLEKLSKQPPSETTADLHDLPIAWQLCKRWLQTPLGKNSRSRRGSAVVHSLSRLDPARLATKRARQVLHDARRVPALGFPKRGVSVQLFPLKLEILFVWVRSAYRLVKEPALSSRPIRWGTFFHGLLADHIIPTRDLL
jgi:hypothetical protein